MTDLNLEPETPREIEIKELISSNIQRPGSNTSSKTAWLIIKWINSRETERRINEDTGADNVMFIRTEYLGKTYSQVKLGKAVLTRLKVIEQYKYGRSFGAGRGGRSWVVYTEEPKPTSLTKASITV